MGSPTYGSITYSISLLARRPPFKHLVRAQDRCTLLLSFTSFCLSKFLQEGSTFKVEAFDSIVTVVDPELSIFDFKLYAPHLVSVSACLTNRNFD